MQTAFTFERQLPANTTLAFTYTNSHGLHQFRSEDVPGVKGPLFLMTSAGLYNQNQLMFNVTSRVSSNASLCGFYILNRARSNTDGRGPGQVTVNMRIGKTWGFGRERGKAAAVVPISPDSGGGGPRPGGGPGTGGAPGPGATPLPANGGGITGGVSSTSRRYNVTVSLSMRNLTNHNNPGPIIGNIT